MDTSIAYAAAAILVVLGLLGTVLPVLPGALLVFGGLFIAAWADGFARVGAVGLSIIGALGLLSFAADFAGSLLGAKRVGASPQALALAAVGGLLGFLFGIPGLILGPFAGAVAGELLAKRNLLQAGKVGLGTWLGLVLAAIAKVLLACAMVVTFAIAWLA